MKKLILILFLLPFYSCSQTNIKFNIPDENFEKALISKKIDADASLNGEVTINDIGSIKKLILSGMNIKNLQGIENFRNLEELWIDRNNLTSIDISKNISLKTLSISENKISDINLSKNTVLEVFICELNKIQTINLEPQKELKIFACKNNLLTQIDLTHNPKLEIISISKNRIRNLNLENNLLLSELECYETDLKKLELNKNLNLTNLSCNSCELEFLDLSKNRKLKKLKAMFNPNLSEICVSDKSMISNPKFEINFKTILKVCNENQKVDKEQIVIADNTLTERDFVKMGKLQDAYNYAKEKLENNPFPQNEHYVNYNFSWYALLFNKNNEAIKAVKRALELKPEVKSIEANLALAYLLDNQWSEAQIIYLKWKGKKFPDNKRLSDSVFLEDINELIKLGIKHKDFDKVKQIFTQ